MIRRHEPLTPEERDLAAQLSRLGPHGEPSPALDSRIMAAAHAALSDSDTGKRKPRWPVAFGLAASVLLAVGVAWQLRPLQETPTVSEAPDLSSVPESASQEPAETQAADAAAAVAVSEPPLQEAPAAPKRVSSVSVVSQEEQKPAAPASARRNVARSDAGAPAAFEEVQPTAERYSPPSPPAPASANHMRGLVAASPPAPAQASIDAERAFVQAEQAAQAKRARDAATISRQQMLESEQRRRQESPTAAASAIVQDTLAEESSSVRAALRRTDLQLPVVEDAKLAPEEWLDRIRLRRDLGDSGNATASLRMFVDAHPFQRVPEDLRPLLGEE